MDDFFYFWNFQSQQQQEEIKQLQDQLQTQQEWIYILCVSPAQLNVKTDVANLPAVAAGGTGSGWRWELARPPTEQAEEVGVDVASFFPQLKEFRVIKASQQRFYHKLKW